MSRFINSCRRGLTSTPSHGTPDTLLPQQTPPPKGPFPFASAALFLPLIVLLAGNVLAQGNRKQLYYDFPTPEMSVIGKDLDKVQDNTNILYDGGYILTGYTDSTDFQTSTSINSLNLTKLDKCGQVIWSNDLKHSIAGYNSRGASVRQTSDNGYIITGSVSTPSGTWDILLIKTDPSGNITWYKKYTGFYGDDFGTSVREVFNPNTGDVDGYIFTGAINNYTDNQYCNNSFENASLIVIRTDMTGVILWQQAIKPLPFGCPPPGQFPDYHHYAYGYDIEQVKDANGGWTNQFIVAGVYRTPMFYDNVPPQQFGCPTCQGPLNEYPLLTSMTDNITAGVINWVKVYPNPVRNGVTGRTTLFSVLQTDIGFVAAGTSVFSAVDQDIYLLETDGGGNMLTARNYDGGIVERGGSVEVTDDNYYVFGASQVGPPPYTSDGLATRIDRATGAATLTQLFGKAGYDNLERSVPEPGERFSTVGLTFSFTAPSAYYFLNNIGDNTFHECEECSREIDLTAYTINEILPVVIYDHDFAYESPEAAEWLSLTPNHSVECECLSCRSVDITFQHGYGVWEDRGHSLRETSDDGFILAGFTGGDDMVNTDILLFKTDDAGAMQWRNTIFESAPGGNVYDERAFSVRQTQSDDGFIVAGDLAALSDRAAYLVKANSGGSPIWSLLLGREASGTAYDDALRSVKQIDDNHDGQIQTRDGFVAAGFSNAPSVPGANLYNALIARIRVNFTGINPIQQWGYTYGHDQDDFFQEVLQTDDDGDGVAGEGFIAVGYSNSTFDDSPGTHAPPTGMGGYNVFVTKTDKLGTVEWSKIYGTDDDEVAYAVYQTDDDNDGLNDDGFIIVGARGTINFLATQEVDNSTSATDFYVVKIAHDGTLQWSATINQEDDAVAYSVIQSSDFSYVLTGEARLANGNMQAVMLKLAECGEILWARHYPEDASTPYNEDHTRELTETSDGGYALFGSTCTYSGQGGTAAKGDFYLIKTDCVGDVCLSGTLALSPVDPGTLEYSVTPLVSNGPDDEQGDPDELEIGVEYNICPANEGETVPVPVPIPGIDLGWLNSRK